MNEQASAHDDADLLEVGMALGQTHAFSLVAGRCSAATAEGLRHLRVHKLYKRCTEKWADFCPQYLKISRVEADRTIALLEEFGPAYFELSQLTRVSPQTFRAIAPHIQDGVLHHNGDLIEMNAANSRRVADAVAELRNTLPKKTPELKALTRELEDLFHEDNLSERTRKLAECFRTIVSELEKIARDERLRLDNSFFQRTLARMRDEIVTLAQKNGV